MKRTAPGLLTLASGRAPAADGLPAAADPSTASFRALARQLRAMGLLDRRPGYYTVKITLTIFAFFAGWTLFVMAGNSWAALAVAPLLGIMFTQLGFIGHDAGHNQIFRARRRNRLLGLVVANALIGLSFGWWVPSTALTMRIPTRWAATPISARQSSRPPLTGRKTAAALSDRGWRAGRRRCSSPSCCCEAAACTYWGSGGLCGGETVRRR
jgi:hypothetical protein